ncbi:MAG: LacI family DNA-binding transcriptional regulator [Waltera sp.]
MGATIKDVAKLAGTSTATVSKVMNGSYSISQETADKVQLWRSWIIIESAGENFARQSARTIIFVAELGKGTGFANPQMFEILCGLEEVLAQKDYTLVVRNIAAGDCAEFIRNAADTKQADGFVIHASVISQALDELLFTHEIPHIVIGNPNFNSHFCWLDIDNRLAGELAAKHLLERGCQSVAFIGGKPEDQISARRLDGVLTVQRA